MIRNPLRASCEETAELMSAHLEGELRRLRRWRVIRHLATCERCRAVLRSLRETIAGLGALARIEPAPQPALAETVIERITREE